MVATVLAQVMALMWQISIFRNDKEMLHFQKGIYRLKRKIVEDTLAIGLSPFLMNSCACIVVIIINRSLGLYGGDLAIGAYGIVNRITFLFVMIVIGLNQGMQPIAGYNFGAQKYDRVLKVLRYTLLWGTIITTSGFLIGEIIPGVCVRAFTSDPQLIDMSEKGMRIVVMFFPLIGMQMVTTNFFQSIGLAGKSIFLSLTRQMLFLVPLTLILPRFWGIDGVWYAMPISDLIAWFVATCMLVNHYKKFNLLAKKSNHE